LKQFFLILSLVVCSLFATTANGATPTIIHKANCSNAQVGVTDYTCPYSIEGSYTGNLIVVGVQFSGCTTLTISDDIGQAFVQAVTVSGGQVVRVYYKPNSAAGSHKIIAHCTATATNFAIQAYEFNNVLLSSPVDVTCGVNTASGTSAPCGSMTTTAASDLIYHFCAQDSAPTNTETWTPNAGFSLLYADRYDSQASEFQVQVSAGAINPTMTMSVGASKTCVGAAFKSVTAGTALPSGAHFIGVSHNALNPSNGYASGATTLQFPCASPTNLIYISTIWEPNLTIPGSVTDSDSQTYTSTGADVSSSTSGNAHTYYKTSATCSNNKTITFTTTGSQVSGSTVHIYEVSGIQGYDSTAGRQTATGTQSVAGNLTTASITPTSNYGISFWVMGVDSNTVPGVTPGYFLSSIPTPVSSPNPTDQNNGWGAYLYYESGTQTFIAASGLGGAYSFYGAIVDTFIATPLPPAGGTSGGSQSIKGSIKIQ
jgi:hypothetical protein